MSYERDGCGPYDCPHIAVRQTEDGRVFECATCGADLHRPSAVVPCQPCLGLGRYLDDVGLTIRVCPACNGSGTDEEYAADE